MVFDEKLEEQKDGKKMHRMVEDPIKGCEIQEVKERESDDENDVDMQDTRT